MEEKWYEYWLANVEGISSARKRKFIGNGTLARDLYYIEETRKEMQAAASVTDMEAKVLAESRRRKDWKAEYRRLTETGVQFLTWRDSKYPGKLRALAGMPYAVYCIGRLPEEKAFSAAIVGARRCTPYGERMAQRFAEVLAEAGVQIISGMARGIDGMAHRGAIRAGGRTFAVLGCGVDICYPREHRGLYEDLKQHGGILSEYAPGTPPLAANFPARNRIISGLADVVLVMEAKERSGSLITADMALEQGRDVYALPGMVESESSRGCNRLIRQGAGILLDPEELLEELNISRRNRGSESTEKQKKNKLMLESVEDMVYSKCDLFPRNREELLRLTGLPPQELAGILVSLELKGYIQERSKNYYVRRK